jgi:hypothetical protein
VNQVPKYSIGEGLTVNDGVKKWADSFADL